MRRKTLGMASLAAGALLIASTFTFAAEAAGRGSGQRAGSSQRVTSTKSANANGSATAKRTAKSNGSATAKKAGPGDGTGNQGSGPKDGTGNGATKGGNGTGTGTCDTTGPKGSQNGNKGGGN